MPLKDSYDHILVEKDPENKGITWLTFNRPEKRNCMNPQLHYDMEHALMALETDDDTKVIVITGAGPAFSAGMDLKEYFRETDDDGDAQFRSFTANKHWSWDLLNNSRKATISMVNGYCFGGGFHAVCNTDFVITADEATYGLSEVNWGIIPGGLVSKLVADAMPFRRAMFYAATGRTFDGKEAVDMFVADFSVPLEKLREETITFAKELMEKNEVVLASVTQGMRAVRNMDVPQSYDYLMSKINALRFLDKENTRDRGMEEFLDKKTFRPGFGAVKPTKD